METSTVTQFLFRITKIKFSLKNIHPFGYKIATSFFFLKLVRVTGIKRLTIFELNKNSHCDSVFIQDCINQFSLKNIHPFGYKIGTSFFATC